MRKRFIEDDPTIGETSKAAEWSQQLTCGDAKVRVFFPPEPKVPKGKEGASIEAVIDAVKNAKSSVVFCLYSPTDLELLDACFKVADDDKMMLGLVNTVPESEPRPNKKDVTDPVKVAIYDRNKKPKHLEIGGHEVFGKGIRRRDFLGKIRLWAKAARSPSMSITSSWSSTARWMILSSIAARPI